MFEQTQKTVRLFTFAQLAIILLFTVVTLVSLVRLADVRALLLSLTQESVPVISQTSQLNNQVQSLATLTTFLSVSNSSPEVSSAKRKIESIIDKINLNLINSDSGSQYLTKQLNTVYEEINELNVLVLKRIEQEESLKASFSRFYDIVFKLFVEGNINLEDKNITNNLLKILLLAVQIDEQSRLHELRKIEQDLVLKIELTQRSLASSNIELRSTIELLEVLAVGENGLVNQKVESLRVAGRTRGRDSFVRNLIADVASNLEFQSQIINQTILDDTSKAAVKTSQQITLAIWAGIISVLITLAIIYFLYKRIVLRLLLLDSQVRTASVDSAATVNISGDDEIANLAKTFSVYLHKVRDQEKALLDMALTDPLTNIPNRRAFDKQIKAMIAQAQRNHWDLTVLLVDIDFFKPYNDHYGHNDGDACLRLVARQLNSVVLRNTDFCARFGGEEFVCLLPNTGANGAQEKAEALRLSIENMRIPHNKSAVGPVVTVSVGVATFPFIDNSNWTADIIIEQADKALYRAKADGRNRCSFFSLSGA